MRYNLTFYLLATEEEAKAFCDNWNKHQNAYARKKYPAHYTAVPYGFCAWYYN